MTHGPVPIQVMQPPVYAAGVKASVPWRRSAPTVEVGPSSAAQFREPGWILMGTDFTVERLGPGRVRLMTETRCRATSSGARRAFAAYWLVVKPFSGVVRREMLAAVARRAEAG